VEAESLCLLIAENSKRIAGDAGPRGETPAQLAHSSKNTKEERGRKMNIKALVAAAVIFVGMNGVAFAECDTHKGDRDTDKQTRCSETCEDAYTSGTMVYGTDLAAAKDKAVACFAACGCQAHGDKFVTEHGTKK
jgi:hypothetical protein